VNHLAANRDDVFLAKRACKLGGFGICINIEPTLRHTATVPQIDEDKVVAVVTIVVDPPGQYDITVNVFRTQTSTIAGSLMIRNSHG
jgi:hypothetical protein